MMRDFNVRSAYNNLVGVALDHDEHDIICGVRIAFVEDGDAPDSYFLRDIESLSRPAALALSLAVAELAVRGLTSTAIAELYARVVGEVDAAKDKAHASEKHSCIIPFPSLSERVSLSFPSDEDPAGAEAAVTAPAGTVKEVPAS